MRILLLLLLALVAASCHAERVPRTRAPKSIMKLLETRTLPSSPREVLALVSRGISLQDDETGIDCDSAPELTRDCCRKVVDIFNDIPSECFTSEELNFDFEKALDTTLSLDERNAALDSFCKNTCFRRILAALKAIFSLPCFQAIEENSDEDVEEIFKIFDYVCSFNPAGGDTQYCLVKLGADQLILPTNIDASPAVCEKWASFGCCLTTFADMVEDYTEVNVFDNRSIFSDVRKQCGIDQAPACPVMGKVVQYLTGNLYFSNMVCKWFEGLTPTQQYSVRHALEEDLSTGLSVPKGGIQVVNHNCGSLQLNYQVLADDSSSLETTQKNIGNMGDSFSFSKFSSAITTAGGTAFDSGTSPKFDASKSGASSQSTPDLATAGAAGVTFSAVLLIVAALFSLMAIWIVE